MLACACTWYYVIIIEVIFTAAVLKQKEEKSSMHLIKNNFRIGEGNKVELCPPVFYVHLLRVLLQLVDTDQRSWSQYPDRCAHKGEHGAEGC